MKSGSCPLDPLARIGSCHWLLVDMEVNEVSNMVAAMEVDIVAAMEVDIVAAMEMDIVADMDVGQHRGGQGGRHGDG